MPPETASRSDVEALAAAIAGLDPAVDPREAQIAAEIAYAYPLELAQQYEITDHPLVHNTLVNNGLRDRGLCNHWAEDMIDRLAEERFKTLSLHWATSPPTFFTIIHHSAAISSRGAPLEDSIILDPWRTGGQLHWASLQEDTDYDWRTLKEVTEMLVGPTPVE